MKDYFPRITDDLLSLYLECSGAVLIEGPKWCGKTTTAKQLAKSVIELGDPDNEEYLRLASISPSLLLDGPAPRLIDEWQIVPKLWDSVRTTIDKRGGFGHFILTGSASPLLKGSDKRVHSGTGRISRLIMRPFSLYESKDSSGQVSLKSLFSGQKDISASKGMNIEELAFICCRGGWPEVCIAENMSERAQLTASKSYVEAICSNEVELDENVVYNREKMARFMHSYARAVGSQCSISNMVKDLSSSESSYFSDKTAYAYLSLLQSIFAVENMPAWNPNLRSKTAIRTSDTRYFSDPSIAVASLGIGPGDLLNDLQTFGFIFENLCIRDLRVYSSIIDGNVFHFRDKNNLECDAVIHLSNGKYGLIEIKLGGNDAIEHGVKSLLKLSESIDDSKMGKPSFLMVLVGVGTYAYRRPDGVFVVPINLLGP